MNAWLGLKVAAIAAAVSVMYAGYASSNETDETCPDRSGPSLAWNSKAAASSKSGVYSAEKLDLSELVAFEGDKPNLSQRTRSLAGHRVQMAGFMAKLELGPRGGFYLAPRPVTADESGAGTADLPLDSVLVVSHSVTAEPIAWMDGPIEVTGQLEIGHAEDSEGRANWIRLRLD